MKNKFYIFILFICFSCSNDHSTNATGSEKQATPATALVQKDKQLNITILLDLSDRIEPSKYPNTPEHYQRDMEIVNHFVNIFKNDMETKGAYKARGKLKVLFSPKPKDPSINTIASTLNIDLSKSKNAQEKKIVFDKISEEFRKNLTTIYKTTIETSNYMGSDTWRFFKNDVVDYTITKDKNYRNILVLITDGYMYHVNSRQNNGNRTTYISPNKLKEWGLRENNYQEIIDSQDFGFITTQKNLENLDVLVLEVNPSKKYLDDEDIIRAYFGKWFNEMGIKKFKIYNTDLPEYTKTRIDNFINN